MTSNARPADALRQDDAPPSAPTSAGMKKVGGVAGWIDDRTGAAKGVGYLMKKVFPDHWSFMLGEIAMYSMIVCMLTGVFLTFWFDPSMAHTTYQGSYVPMQGVEMSRAYASTLDISFDVRGPASSSLRLSLQTLAGAASGGAATGTEGGIASLARGRARSSMGMPQPANTRARATAAAPLVVIAAWPGARRRPGWGR